MCVYMYIYLYTYTDVSICIYIHCQMADSEIVVYTCISFVDFWTFETILVCNLNVIHADLFCEHKT